MTTLQKSCPIFLTAFGTFCDPHSSIFSFVHELFPTKERSFVVLVRYLFLNHIFFHALRLPYVFFCLLYSPSTSSALPPRLPLSHLLRIHPSSCPKPFCFWRCKVNGLKGSCLCNTAMSLPSCLCTHLLSGYLTASCLYLCRSAHIFAHILISSSCRRSNTSRSCCSQ